MLARVLKHTSRCISTTKRSHAPLSCLFKRSNQSEAKTKVVPTKDPKSTETLVEYHRLYNLINSIQHNGTKIGEVMKVHQIPEECLEDYSDEELENAKKSVLSKPNPHHEAINTAVNNAYKSLRFAFSIGDFWYRDDVLQIKSADGTLINCGKINDISKEILLAQCTPAPFGDLVTMSTVVDPTVRSAWELDYDKVVIKNKKKPHSIDYQRQVIAKMLAQVQVDFQDDSLYLEPYKLNVYTKGGFFKPHKDTPRFENMVGTLVAVLIGGGALVVRHDNEKFVEEESNTTAFFSDRVHEIEPVENDIRVSLTFNICKESASVPKSPQAITYKSDAPLVKGYNIASLIDTIKKSPLKAIGILTEFDYTQKGISTQSLKGNDRLMFEELSKEPTFEVDLLPVVVSTHYCDDYTSEEFPRTVYNDGSVYRFLTEDMDRMLADKEPSYEDDIVFFWRQEGLNISEHRQEAAERVGNHSMPQEVDNIYFNGAIIVKNLNAEVNQANKDNKEENKSDGKQ